MADEAFYLRFPELKAIGVDENGEIMKVTILIFLSVICVTLATYSQEKTASVSETKFQPDKSKPSVYITFERLGGNKPLVKSNEDNSERISLRLQNNTSLPLAVEADGEYTINTLLSITLSDGGKGYALPNGAEVEVCFEAEAMPQMTAEDFAKIKVPKQIPSYYSCKWTVKRRGRGNVWVLPGNSIVFSVPRDFLAKNLKIYTLFNYEWESENGQMKANEPQHQVFFYSTDLPYKLREK
jgi:hypothetical protein